MVCLFISLFLEIGSSWLNLLCNCCVTGFNEYEDEVQCICSLRCFKCLWCRLAADCFRWAGSIQLPLQLQYDFVVTIYSVKAITKLKMLYKVLPSMILVLGNHKLDRFYNLMHASCAFYCCFLMPLKVLSSLSLMQIHATLPRLILHLHDDDLSVRLACRVYSH